MKTNTIFLNGINKLGLQTAPNVLYFPPTKQGNNKVQPVKYDLSKK